MAQNVETLPWKGREHANKSSLSKGPQMPFDWQDAKKNPLQILEDSILSKPQLLKTNLKYEDKKQICRQSKLWRA
jgi:hypothetical protein